MATHTAAKSKTATLAAGIVDHVTITDIAKTIEVLHHGSVLNPLFVTCGENPGSPTAGGDDLEVVLPGERLQLKSPPGQASTDVVVSIVSVGAVTYTVIGVQ